MRRSNSLQETPPPPAVTPEQIANARSSVQFVYRDPGLVITADDIYEVEGWFDDNMNECSAKAATTCMFTDKNGLTFALAMHGAPRVHH